MSYLLGELTDLDLMALSYLVLGLGALLFTWRKYPKNKSVQIIPLSLIIAQVPATVLTMIFSYGNTWFYAGSTLVSGLLILGIMSLYLGTLETEKGDDVATRLLLLDWVIEEDLRTYRVFSRGEARLLVHKDGDLVHLLLKDVGYPDDLITPELRDWIFSDTHTHTQALNESSEPGETLSIKPPKIFVVRHTHTHISINEDPETDSQTKTDDE